MDKTIPGSFSAPTESVMLSKFVPKSVIDKVSCPRIPEMLSRQVNAPDPAAFNNISMLAYIGGFGQNIWYTRGAVRSSSDAYEFYDPQNIGGYSVWDFGRFHFPDPFLSVQVDWSPTAALTAITGDQAIRATGSYTRVPGLDQNLAVSLLSRVANADCSGLFFRIALAIGELVFPAFDSLMPEFAAINHHTSYNWQVDVVSNFVVNAPIYNVHLTTQMYTSDNVIIWSNAIAHLSPIAQIMLLKAFAPLFRIEWLFAQSPGNVRFRRWDLDVNDVRQANTNSVVCYKYASLVAGRDPSNPIDIFIVVPHEVAVDGINFCGQVLDLAHPNSDLTHQIIEQTINHPALCHAAAHELFNLVRQCNPTAQELYWFNRGLMFEWGDRHTVWPVWDQPRIRVQPDDTVNRTLAADVASAFMLFAGCRFGDGLPLILRRPQPTVSLSPLGLRTWGFKAGEPVQMQYSLNDARLVAWASWMCVSWLTTPSMSRPLEFNTHYAVYKAVWEQRPTIQMVERFDLRDLSLEWSGATLHYVASEWLHVVSFKPPKPISENVIDRIGGELVLMYDGQLQSVPCPIRFSNPGFNPCRYGHGKTNDTKFAYRAAYYFHPDYPVRFGARVPSTTPYQPAAEPANFTPVSAIDM